MHVVFGKVDFFDVRWTKKFEFGGFIGNGDPYLEFNISHSKVFRQPESMMLLEHCDHIVNRPWFLLHDWKMANLLYAWSREWTTLLLLRKKTF